MFKNFDQAIFDAKLINSINYENNIREFFKDFCKKSIIVINVERNIKEELKSLNLFEKINCLHFSINNKNESHPLLGDMAEYPITINVDDSNVELFSEIINKSKSKFVNLTVNINSLVDIKQILRIKNLSKWGIHIYNNTITSKKYEENCKNRLILSIDERGDVFPCVPLMKAGIGSLGNIKNPDYIKENIISSEQLKIWFSKGPEFINQPTKNDKHICENHINDLLLRTERFHSSHK